MQNLYILLCCTNRLSETKKPIKLSPTRYRTQTDYCLSIALCNVLIFIIDLQSISRSIKKCVNSVIIHAKSLKIYHKAVTLYVKQLTNTRSFSNQFWSKKKSFFWTEINYIICSRNKYSFEWGVQNVPTYCMKKVITV